MYRVSQQWWETVPNPAATPNAPRRRRRGVRRRLHRDRGPARVEKWFHNEGDPTPFRTKRSWWWHGVRIPKYFGEGGKITFKHILKQTNSEVFRILVEAYGFEKFTDDLKEKKLKRYVDDFGTIWQLHRPRDPNDETSWTIRQSAWRQRNLLELVNSTPEPDGSYKRYFEWVRTDVTSPKEAIARQFGLRVTEYHPEVET